MRKKSRNNDGIWRFSLGWLYDIKKRVRFQNLAIFNFNGPEHQRWRKKKLQHKKDIGDQKTTGCCSRRMGKEGSERKMPEERPPSLIGSVHQKPNTKSAMIARNGMGINKKRKRKLHFWSRQDGWGAERIDTALWVTQGTKFHPMQPFQCSNEGWLRIFGAAICYDSTTGVTTRPTWYILKRQKGPTENADSTVLAEGKW